MSDNTVISKRSQNCSNGSYGDEANALGFNSEAKYIINKRCSRQFNCDAVSNVEVEDTILNSKRKRCSEAENTDTQKRKYNNTHVSSPLAESSSYFTEVPRDHFKGNGFTEVSAKVYESIGDLKEKPSEGRYDIEEAMVEDLRVKYLDGMMECILKSMNINEIHNKLDLQLKELCRDIKDLKDKECNKKVNHLLHEKTLLCNIIKSQYENIKKLKEMEMVALKCDEERIALKNELKRLQDCMNACISKKGINHRDFSFNDDSFSRKPPDVY